MASSGLKFDQIGYWSQLKLDIVKDYVKDYATAYSTILAKQPKIRHVYIDAFAGAGVHQLKSTGELVPGSPLNALAVVPPFTELHLVDLDGAKIDNFGPWRGSKRLPSQFRCETARTPPCTICSSRRTTRPARRSRAISWGGMPRMNLDDDRPPGRAADANRRELCLGRRP